MKKHPAPPRRTPRGRSSSAAAKTDAMEGLVSIFSESFSAQVRATRAWFKLSQAELAELAGVSVSTVRRLESAVSKEFNVDTLSLWKVVRVLEANGVMLIDPDPDAGLLGGGVFYLRKPQASWSALRANKCV